MLLEEVRIIAHICGDGWLSTYLEPHSLHVVHGRRYWQKRRRYCVGYCNTESVLLKEFEKDVLKVYGIKCQKTSNERRFKSKRVFLRLKQLGAGGSRNWFIHQSILNSKSKFRKAWLRCFFDDEAAVDCHNNEIRIKSMNLQGLKKVKKLLRSLLFSPSITGPNCDGSWYLHLRGKDIFRYNKLINFKHPQKRRKLRLLIKKVASKMCTYF